MIARDDTPARISLGRKGGCRSCRWSRCMDPNSIPVGQSNFADTAFSPFELLKHYLQPVDDTTSGSPCLHSGTLPPPSLTSSPLGSGHLVSRGAQSTVWSIDLVVSVLCSARYGWIELFSYHLRLGCARREFTPCSVPALFVCSIPCWLRGSTRPRFVNRNGCQFTQSLAFFFHPIPIP